MKIGIYGGSFDPVHFGHIFLAEDAKIAAGLDQVIFVPVKLQPFKQERQVASGEHRCNMLSLAFEEAGFKDTFQVSDFELKKDGVSYTYETLRAFREKFPDSKIYFIIGSDSIKKLDMWKNAEEILKNHDFIVGKRPGEDEDALKRKAQEITAKFGTEFVITNNRQFDISSTYVRKNVYLEDLPDRLVPVSVERYIEENGLYRELSEK